MKHTLTPFGAAVDELMAAKKITFRGLAATTGLSAGYLNHIVHGNRPVPDNSVMDRIADALGVKIDYFAEFRVRAIAGYLELNPAESLRLYKKYDALLKAA